jgi:hypothetical protein
MFRKSSNNPFIPVGGLNSGSFSQIGGPETVNQRFKGLLGQTVVYDNAAALKASKLSVGTLYAGVYQLVKLNSSVLRGQVCYWDTLANNGLNDFEVTTTVTAPAIFKAGIAICDGTNGEFVWIQIAGLASVLYRAAVTSAVLGNLVITTSATAADCDALADAGAFSTALAMKQLVGTAYELPVNSSIRRVSLNLAGFLQNI